MSLQILLPTPTLHMKQQKINVIIMVERLPSSFGITNNLSIEPPCFPNTSLTCEAMALLEVSVVSKKLMIT
jgi:hypothetical protein